MNVRSDRRTSRRQFFLFLLLVMAAAVLAACIPPDPSPPPSTTTTMTTSTTTTIPAGEVRVSTESQLRMVVGLGGAALVASPITLSETLWPGAGSTIRFDGAGKLIHPAGMSGRTIQVAAADVTFVNLQIEGTNACVHENTLPYNPHSIGERYGYYDPAREHWHGIGAYDGADRLTILGGRIFQVWGDAIYMNGATDVRIEGLTVRCAGRGGVVAVDVEDLDVVGGHVSGTFWWPLNFEPFGNLVIRDVDVSATVIGFSRWPWLHAGGGEGGNCQLYDVDVSAVILLPQSTRPSSVHGCVYYEVTLPSGDVNG